MSEVITTEWDGPVLETEPSDGELNHAIGPITRRKSTNTPPPEQNTCLCGDCLCCCKYLCPWCGLS